MEELTFDELARRYCERQENTPEGLRAELQDRVQRFNPDGFVLLECQMMDSSSLGSLTILPYGPNNSLKTIPTHPVSPRGLASDMSIAVAFMKADRLEKLSMYEVIVGNVGLVHSGTRLDTATKEYEEYVQKSEAGVGRAGNEDVTLMRDGEPIKEHHGPAEDDNA